MPKTILDLPVLLQNEIDDSDVFHIIDVSTNLDKQTTVGFYGQWLFQDSGYNLQVTSTDPKIRLYKSNNLANEKLWDFNLNATKLFGTIRNDADTSGQDWLEVTRTTTTVDEVKFPNGNLNAGNVFYVNKSNNSVGIGQSVPIADAGLHIKRDVGGGRFITLDRTDNALIDDIGAIGILTPDTAVNQGVFIGSDSAARLFVKMNEPAVGIGTSSITANQALDVVFADDTNNAGVTFRNSDSYFAFANGTGAINRAIPWFKIQTSSSTNTDYCLISGDITTDTGTTAVLRFRSLAAAGTVGTRPLFDWSNNTATLMTMDKDGNLGIGTTTTNLGFTKQIVVLSNGQTGMLIASSRADADGAAIGDIRVRYETNTTNHEQIAGIGFKSDGGTANQRGGKIIFYTKANGSTTFSERGAIDNIGNLGLGIAVPAQKFHMYNSSGNTFAKIETGSTNNTGVILTTPASSAAMYLIHNSYLRLDGPGAIESMIINTSGNIGVGTTTSVQGLVTAFKANNATEANIGRLNANNSFTIQTTYTDGNFIPGITWQTTNDNPDRTKLAIYGKATSTGSYMYLRTAISYATGAINGLAIDPNGNLGIGTDAPERLLHVYAGNSTGSSSSIATMVLESNATQVLQFLSPNTTNQAIYFSDPDDSNVGQILYNHTDNSMFFGTSDAERMRITSSGNLGLGSTTPNYTSANGPVLTIESSGATDQVYLEFARKSASIADNHILGGLLWYAGSTPNLVSGVVSSTEGVTENTAKLIFYTASSGTYAERMRIAPNGKIFTNAEIADSNLAIGGMCFQTGTENISTDCSITSKNNSVGHGVTSLVETDTFYTVQGIDSTGGALIRGFNSTAQDEALIIMGVCGTPATSYTGNGVVEARAYKSSGTSTQQLADNENAFVIKNRLTTLFTVKGDGTIYSAKARKAAVAVAFTTAQTQNDVYDALAPYLPDGEICIASGAYGTAPIVAATRNGTTSISVTYSSGATNVVFTNGSASTIALALAISL